MSCLSVRLQQFGSHWLDYHEIGYLSILRKYEAYSESKYHFAVKKSNNISYKILWLSFSTFFKLFFHIFAAIIEVFIVAGHKFLYTLLIECGRLRRKRLLTMSQKST